MMRLAAGMLLALLIRAAEPEGIERLHQLSFLTELQNHGGTS